MGSGKEDANPSIAGGIRERLNCERCCLIFSRSAALASSVSVSGSVALTEHQVSSLFFSESRTMSLIRNVFKRLHYPVDIIAQCVRWYLAYSLSLRNLEEIMAERGIAVDHSTLSRWVHRLVPLIVKRYRRRMPAVGGRWRMDETYIKIKGQWRYLYRAVDS
ncbi:IS6 family transposase, partial [Xenorhabdus bovienii]|uniref:IS6 family transposase n=1 Tax=Xenorhabdus bovienii TaxID=40576 RepID=UPI0023B2AB2D